MIKYRAGHNTLQKNTILILCVSFIFLLASCGGGGSISNALGALNATQKVEFKVLKSGHSSEFEKKEFIVVTNNQEFIDIWEKTTGTYAPDGNEYYTEIPDIDFQNNTVIAVFSGNRPSGGYGISVTEISETIKSVIVEVSESSPHPGTYVTDAFTQPFQIVQTKKITKPILFE